jgi:hypothetical protein
MFRPSSSTPSSISDAEKVSAITGQEDRVSLPSMHVPPGRQAYFQIIYYILQFHTNRGRYHYTPRKPLDRYLHNRSYNCPIINFVLLKVCILYLLYCINKCLAERRFRKRKTWNHTIVLVLRRYNLSFLVI